MSGLRALSAKKLVPKRQEGWEFEELDVALFYYQAESDETIIFFPCTSQELGIVCGAGFLRIDGVEEVREQQ